MLFMWVIIVHAPRIVPAMHNPDEWTSGLVALANDLRPRGGAPGQEGEKELLKEM
jgi:hypothetical protein